MHMSGHSHATCIQPHGARNMATLVAPIPPYGYIRMHKGVWARSARSQVCNWRPDQKKVFSRHFQLSDMDRTQVNYMAATQSNQVKLVPTYPTQPILITPSGGLHTHVHKIDFHYSTIGMLHCEVRSRQRSLRQHKTMVPIRRHQPSQLRSTMGQLGARTPVPSR